MDFSSALVEIKAGARLTRIGWNGKGMFLFYNPGSVIRVSEGRPLASAFEVGSEVSMEPYIMMCTASKSCVPWLASQTDLLANDWIRV